MSRYQLLLENYARAMGLEPTEALLSSQEVVIGGVVVGLTLQGDEDAGNIAFFTDLGRPSPEVEAGPLHILMLQANALWVGTGGCTLGLQGATGTVLLCCSVSLADCDAAALASALDGFADVALLWKEVIEGRVMPQLPEQTQVAA